MVLSQLLLPTGASRDPAMTALAETRRELVDRFKSVTAYVRSPAKGLWTAPDGHTEADDVMMVACTSSVLMPVDGSPSRGPERCSTCRITLRA